MTPLVVDASVAVKWFIPEVHADAARRLLDAQYELSAPDLIWSEVGNTLWKKQRRGEIDPPIGRAILSEFRRFPIHIYSSDLLLETAWELAAHLDRSLYDSLYLALAQMLSCPLVTADLRLRNALHPAPPGLTLVWLANF